MESRAANPKEGMNHNSSQNIPFANYPTREAFAPIFCQEFESLEFEDPAEDLVKLRERGRRLKASLTSCQVGASYLKQVCEFVITASKNRDPEVVLEGVLDAVDWCSEKYQETARSALGLVMQYCLDSEMKRSIAVSVAVPRRRLRLPVPVFPPWNYPVPSTGGWRRDDAVEIIVKGGGNAEMTELWELIKEMQPQHTRVKENLGEFEEVVLDERDDEVERDDDVALVKESYGKTDEEVVKEVQQQHTKVKESYREIDEGIVEFEDPAEDLVRKRGRLTASLTSCQVGASYLKQVCEFVITASKNRDPEVVLEGVLDAVDWCSEKYQETARSALGLVMQYCLDSEMKRSIAVSVAVPRRRLRLPVPLFPPWNYPVPSTGGWRRDDAVEIIVKGGGNAEMTELWELIKEMQPQHTRVKENLGEFDDVAPDESDDDVALVKESYGKTDEEPAKEVQQQHTKVKESYREIDDAALVQSNDDPTVYERIVEFEDPEDLVRKRGRLKAALTSCQVGASYLKQVCEFVITASKNRDPEVVLEGVLDAVDWCSEKYQETARSALGLVMQYCLDSEMKRSIAVSVALPRRRLRLPVPVFPPWNYPVPSTGGWRRDDAVEIIVKGGGNAEMTELWELIKEMQPQHTRVKENLGEFEDVAPDESDDDVALVKESYGKTDEELVKEVQQQHTKVKESYREIDDAALVQSNDDPTVYEGIVEKCEKDSTLNGDGN